MTPGGIGSIRTWLQKIKLSGAQNRIPKKTYIMASKYNSPSFRHIYNKLKSDPTWHVYQIPSGHDAMIDMPERLGEILQEVA